MTDEKTVYASDAERYEALVSREDHQGHILASLQQIVRPDNLDIVDLGAGTGRLAALLAARSHSMCAFDTSHHMLVTAREKLLTLAPGRQLTAVADHRSVPLRAHSTDLVVSGWSVSYVAVWSPDTWRAELDAWLAEMRRLLRPGGTIILYESLGTGNDTPVRLPHLANFYPWLDEAGFQNSWIRTDYRFESVGQAAELAGNFFGDAMAARIRDERLTVLPECTGVWWKTLANS